MMENENDLTRCEIVLHEFNKKSIDMFLQAHGFGITGQDWSRKIKVVLLIIEEIQLGIRNEKYAKK